MTKNPVTTTTRDRWRQLARDIADLADQADHGHDPTPRMSALLTREAVAISACEPLPCYTPSSPPFQD